MCNKMIQFIKFGIVGGINTLVSLGVYYFMLWIGFHYLLATIAGYVISSIIGYVLNRIWVFHALDNSIRSTTIKYYILYGTALVLNMILNAFWINIMHVSKYTAPFLTLCFTVPFNFLCNKYWVFREKGAVKHENYAK